MVSSVEHELLLSCISQVSTSGDDSIPLSDKTDIPTYITALTYRMIAMVVNNTLCKVHSFLFDLGIMYSSSHSCGGDDTAVSDDDVGVLDVVFDFMIVVYESYINNHSRQNLMMNVLFRYVLSLNLNFNLNKLFKQDLENHLVI